MDSPSTPDRYIAVGRISGPFGIKGELKVDVLTDFPQRFEPGSRLFLTDKPVTVQSARVSGRDRLIVQLEQVRSRTEAETIPRGATLDVREEDVIPLPDGAYYRFQLLGLPAVSDDSREPIGTVADILETGVNDVLVVRADGQPEALIPNTSEVVTVDLEAGLVLVKPIEGLLPSPPADTVQEQDQQPAQKRRRRRRRR